jgi:hypothetical protein
MRDSLLVVVCSGSELIVVIILIENYNMDSADVPIEWRLMIFWPTWAAGMILLLY